MSDSPSNAKAIDKVHLDLIRSLVVANGPVDHALELGLGVRSSLDIVLSLPCMRVTIVENWLDWGGVPQPVDLPAHAKLVTADEQDFIENCQESFGLIISDADHYRAEQWWRKTYDLLEPGGMAFWHDVSNPMFPNLATIPLEMREQGFYHKVFDYYSDEDRAWRGLLVAFA